MKCTHVKLTYFKKTGKYYSEGEIDFIHEPKPVMFYDAINQIAEMLNARTRPGLVDGLDFDVLAVVYTDYGPLPHLFVRDKDGYVGSRSMRMNEKDVV